MRYFVRALVVLLAAFAMPAWADDTEAAPKKDTIGVHLFSHHFPAENYNNVNPGLYYRLAEGPVMGFYRNSVRRLSIYAGYTFEWGRFDLTLGAVTGYEYAAQPLVVPSVALFTVRGVTGRLAYIPHIEKRIGSNVLHFAIEM